MGTLANYPEPQLHNFYNGASHIYLIQGSHETVYVKHSLVFSRLRKSAAHHHGVTLPRPIHTHPAESSLDSTSKMHLQASFVHFHYHHSRLHLALSTIIVLVSSLPVSSFSLSNSSFGSGQNDLFKS